MGCYPAYRGILCSFLTESREEIHILCSRGRGRLPPFQGGWNSIVNDASLLISRAKSAHEIDDEADQQNEAKSSSTDGGTAEIKSAATEQEKTNDNYQDKVHDRRIVFRDGNGYTGLPDHPAYIIVSWT